MREVASITVIFELCTDNALDRGAGHILREVRIGRHIFPIGTEPFNVSIAVYNFGFHHWELIVVWFLPFRVKHRIGGIRLCFPCSGNILEIHLALAAIQDLKEASFVFCFLIGVYRQLGECEIPAGCRDGPNPVQFFEIGDVA